MMSQDKQIEVVHREDLTQDKQIEVDHKDVMTNQDKQMEVVQ